MTPLTWFHYEHGRPGRRKRGRRGSTGRGTPDGRQGARRRPPKPIHFRLENR